ncbi:MAG: hypothetical protein CSA81_12290 [Acidobacteria bacterium]|nr:MAG: hypothetical protein CSA81_12290 [Acidobacteriota bacterium]
MKPLILFVSIFITESYYVDGTEFVLKDATRILTLEEVKTDLYNYWWYEDGAYISIAKSNVQKVNCFSFREVGRAPKKKSSTIHQRRIRDGSVVYMKDKVPHLRVLHVNSKGRSIEGTIKRNKVKYLNCSVEGDYRKFNFELSMTDPDYRLEFHFFDMKGKRLLTELVDLDMFQVNNKERKKRLLHGFFYLPVTLNPEQVGLIEVLSVPRAD